MGTVTAAIEAHHSERNKELTEDTTASSDTASTDPKSLRHELIAVVAYRFWHERGCPDGSPETDWFRAEEHLLSLNGSPDEME